MSNRQQKSKSRGKTAISCHKRAKPEFIVDYNVSPIKYDPILDRNLEYYFSSHQNRRILRKNRIINRKNEILDRSLNKLIANGQASLSSSFKMRKSIKPIKVSGKYKTVESSLGNEKKSIKTVNKLEFLRYLQNEKMKISAWSQEKKLSKLPLFLPQ